MTAPTRLATLDERPAQRPIANAILARQAGSFAIVGVASTLAYVALYALLRGIAPAGTSNAIALVVTALSNTAANRRLTFGVRGSRGLVRDHSAGLGAFLVALAITSTALAGLAAVAPAAGRAVELAVLVAANAVATLARFVLLRSWIARDRPPERSPTNPERNVP